MKFEKFHIMIYSNEKRKPIIIEVKGTRINEDLAVCENPLYTYRKQHFKSLIHIASGLAIKIYDYVTWKEAVELANTCNFPVNDREIKRAINSAEQKYHEVMERNKGRIYRVENKKLV